VVRLYLQLQLACFVYQPKQANCAYGWVYALLRN
jgi:hypothetical protein